MASAGFEVVDYIHSGEAGEAFSVLLAFWTPPGAATPVTVFVPDAVTETLTGVYRVSFTPTDAGDWFLSLEGTVSGEWAGTFAVGGPAPDVVGGSTLSGSFVGRPGLSGSFVTVR